MAKVLITGAGGFLGKNLKTHIENCSDDELFLFYRDTPLDKLDEFLGKVDVVYHFAGVNRIPPGETEEKFDFNFTLTRYICEKLKLLGNKPIIKYSSSVSVNDLNSAYGKSKRVAEKILEEYGQAVIYRLPNVFGKWCKPSYNSVVATFCYNIINGQQIYIRDRDVVVKFMYVDDVVKSMTQTVDFGYITDFGTYDISLGDLADKISLYEDLRRGNIVPDLTNQLDRKLYATFMSYVDTKKLKYSLAEHTDPRGTLAEVIKSANVGQFFISRTNQGFVRGGHYHNTKIEKFIVVNGCARVELRNLSNGEVSEFSVVGNGFDVIDIPPGYSHSLENVGDGELVVLFWSSEIFDVNNQDTHRPKVAQ